MKALQIHNRYLVAESDEGVLVIDQHALHERILYEHLRTRILAGSVESQNLLVPEPVDLNPGEAAAAMEERELLAQLGMKIEAFGGDTVLITSYPAMLANMNPVEVLHEIVGRLVSGRQASRQPRPARFAAAHHRLQGGDQGRRLPGAGRSANARPTAAPHR